MIGLFLTNNYFPIDTTSDDEEEDVENIEDISFLGLDPTSPVKKPEIKVPTPTRVVMKAEPTSPTTQTPNVVVEKPSQPRKTEVQNEVTENFVVTKENKHLQVSM